MAIDRASILDCAHLTPLSVLRQRGLGETLCLELTALMGLLGSVVGGGPQPELQSAGRGIYVPAGPLIS